MNRWLYNLYCQRIDADVQDIKSIDGWVERLKEDGVELSYILAWGVSNVPPLGKCEKMFPGMPHDGMPVLSQLVDWKNG